MAKRKNKVIHKDITELKESRTGGQVALRGYSYQFLYSCYLMLLSSDENTVFSLEGIEDIDKIRFTNGEETVTHIQLKYSTTRQDASFMKDVLKNYLEAYLISQDRYFKLVYDFSVAKGNLSKLFFGTLDTSSKKYWKDKVEEIEKETSNWNWGNFDFDDFMSRLSFEKVDKSILESEIEKILISRFQIDVNNIILYANAIKLFCFDKMACRGDATCDDLLRCIEKTKFEISKGVQNPAHFWIQRLDFSKTEKYASDYFEGKKATPADIANNLPIERTDLEKEIIDSIRNNTITVIKTSSGQGKTTLAFRAMLALQEEYTPYQITWCNNISELSHIVEYFRIRTRIGEKPILLLDNLDSHLSQWNMLAQLMQTGVTYHYKILVTSRENDWYNYSGDMSNLHSMQIVKPYLSESEAALIFKALQKSGMLHQDVTDWKKAWNRISDRQLLIEYVYLLTHGEMIAERISSQMKEIGMALGGKTKCEILRKVCFADMCGIRLETKALIKNLDETVDLDVGEILKSLAEEFLVHVSTEGDYIEGLHPVRSQHIVNCLHEYISIDETALSVSKIAEKADLSVLFSHYPQFDLNKNDFYSKIADAWWNLSDLSRLVEAIRGAFSGSVMQYFQKNKGLFDDAYRHGGLMLVIIDTCPFAKFEDYDEEIDTLDKLLEIHPDNGNVKYLAGIRDALPRFEISKTDIYCLCQAVYEKLKNTKCTEITDIESYASIIYWLYNMDSSMNLTLNIDLDYIWHNAEQCSLKAMSSLMYSSFCGNKDAYMKYVGDNLPYILSFLKRKTDSHILSVEDGYKTIKVEYILSASEITKGNNESVSRLTDICRTLPIFDLYYSDAIKPKLDILDMYQVPDNSHKEMPRRNLVISFNQEFNGLWLNTIQSNYEFDTKHEWVDHWLLARQKACDMLAASCSCMYKLLANNKLGSVGKDFDQSHARYNSDMIAHLGYPREYRPFEKKPKLPEKFNKAKQGYFSSLQNFANQFVDFIKKEERFERLAVHNLNTALAALPNVQNFFEELSLDTEQKRKHLELKALEEKFLFETYACCEYFKSHMPTQYFNKYQVKTWFLTSQKSSIDAINSQMTELAEKYDALLPRQIYRENTFSCYPILLRNFNIENEDMMNDFLISSLSFLESPYDYLILLQTNATREVMKWGVKFSRRCYQYLDDSLTSGEEKEMDILTTPYPIEVDNKLLDCFEEPLMLQNIQISKPWLGAVADIAEKLWVYSKNRELLSEKEDEQRLCVILGKIRTEILGMLEEAASTATAEEHSFVVKMCEEVFSGEQFSDQELNAIYARIQEETLAELV